MVDQALTEWFKQALGLMDIFVLGSCHRRWKRHHVL